MTNDTAYLQTLDRNSILHPFTSLRHFSSGETVRAS
jgi:hypothetical protein